MFVSLLMQNFPEQLLGQVCQKKGELLLLVFFSKCLHIVSVFTVS